MAEPLVLTSEEIQAFIDRLDSDEKASMALALSNQFLVSAIFAAPNAELPVVSGDVTVIELFRNNACQLDMVGDLQNANEPMRIVLRDTRDNSQIKSFAELKALRDSLKQKPTSEVGP